MQNPSKENNEYHEFIEKANDIIYMFDLQGDILSINQVAEKLLGYSQNELIGMNIMSLVAPEYINYATTVIEKILSGQNETSTYQIKIFTKDKKEFFMEANAWLVYKNNTPVAIQGIARDITGRKFTEEALLKSEQRLEEAHRIAKLGNWEFDLATQQITWSSELFNLFDMDVAKSPSFPEYLSFIHQETVQSHQQEIYKAMVEGVPYDSIHKATTQKNKVKYFNMRGKPLYDESQKIYKLVGTAQDITEQKELEQRLIQAQKMESIGVLAGGVAHDFNNVLTMILSAATILKMQTEEDSKTSKYITMLMEAAERGATTAKQLLMFARSDKMSLKAISVSAVLTETSQLLQHTFPKSITITVENTLADGEDIIMGDSGNIHQIIINLAVNAKDAMSNTGTLSLTLQKWGYEKTQQLFPDCQQSSYIVLTISDTGSGMTEEVKQKMFDPFFTTKEIGKGTGLGLSIVHGIVKNHKAYIHVETEVNKGTSISIFFQDMSETEQKQLNLKEAKMQSGNETILLVDDEEIIRDACVDILSEFGYSTIATPDGHTALDTYKKQKENIALAIIDLGMPNMDGKELLQHLLILNPEIKVIIASGYVDDGTKKEMLRKGAKDVIGKPFGVNELLETIRKALDN